MYDENLPGDILSPLSILSKEAKSKMAADKGDKMSALPYKLVVAATDSTTFSDPIRPMLSLKFVASIQF